MIKYILVNIIFVGLLYLALFEGSVGAENLVGFWTVVLFMGACGLYNTKVEELKKVYLENPYKLNKAFKAFDNALDASIIALMVWHGWFIIGALYFAHFALYMVMKDKVLTEINAKSA